MSKITRHDLQAKTLLQLAALFQEASLRISTRPDARQESADASAQLALIRSELAIRHHLP